MATSFLYADFYEPVIQKERRGLKLVPGGTGLGKTGGISEAVQRDPSERKYIYCTNRVQLLEEMEQSLAKVGIGHAHLRRDSQVIQRVLAEPASRRGFYSLLESPRVQRLTASVRAKYRQPLFNVHRVAHLCNEIAQMRNVPGDFMAELLEGRTRQVMSFWKDLLRYASDDGRGQPMADWFRLVEEPIIHQLFPYLHFKQTPTARVLLVTIQKLYHGFFDGRRSVDIFGLVGEDGGRVIFLDEFDFLEGNLVDLLCQDTAIHAPFHFVEQFYRSMTRDRLPLAAYPLERDSTREEIEDIIAQIDTLAERGVSFPQQRQFVFSEQLQETPTLFQTNRSIWEEPLFLEPGERAMRLVTGSSTHSEQAVEALELFRTVHAATHQIIALFRGLALRDPVAYQELRRHAFEHTIFEAALERTHQVPLTPQGQPTGFDSLLASGYGLFELRHLQQETDPEEVEWRYLSLYTTPEAILAGLAQDNLLFGLSATALLTRYLQGFNMDWLAAQERVTVHPLTDDDRATVKHLDAQKQALRGSKLTVARAGKLERAVPAQRLLLDTISAIATDPNFGGDDPAGHRRARVEHFFSTLQWIATQPEVERATSTHLLFFNSYLQIEHLFLHHSRTDDDPPLWEIRPSRSQDRYHPVFRYYEMDFAGTSFVVIFYDAARAQQLEGDEASQTHFDEAFWQGKPVLLVTTYPSAGNGVNLQYRPFRGSDERCDFTTIHLLDSPYYYFTPLEAEMSSQERLAAIKKNIWYLAKLHEAKLLSEAQFRRFLKSAQHGRLNAFYHHDSGTQTDAVLNQVATFVQALGRIERVWRPQPNQTVRLSSEVWSLLARFASEPTFAVILEGVWPWLSNNLRELLTQLTSQLVDLKRQQRRLRDERLPAQDQRSRKAVATLLQRLVSLRAGQLDPQVRADWQHLRQAVLRHDVQDELVRQYGCALETPYIEGGVVYLTPQRFIVPDTVEGGDTRRWNLNAAYSIVRANPVIRRHFEHHRFEMHFRVGGRYLFTPYCYQAILLGAIGEEAIYALLQAEGVDLEALPDVLFELADMKLAGRPWYVDCKNYSDRTLHLFPLPPEDPAWRPTLNDAEFQVSALRKLAALRRIHADAPERCKLFYLNLATTDDWVARYFDAEFQSVRHINEAAIVVIPSVLQGNAPARYTEGFTRLLPLLRSASSLEDLS